MLNAQEKRKGESDSLQVSVDTVQLRSPSSSSQSAETFEDMKGRAKDSLDKNKQTFTLWTQWIIKWRRNPNNKQKKMLHATETVICTLKVKIRLYLWGVCSPVKTSATGFPLCWVETQGRRPHPSGTKNVHKKDKDKPEFKTGTQIRNTWGNKYSPDPLALHWSISLYGQRVLHSIRKEWTRMSFTKT